MTKMGFFDKRNRVLLAELVKTDFKLRYQGSVLGILWSVLKPLMIFVVMYFVFVKFLRITDPSIPNYAITLLLGLSLWAFFTEAVTLGMTSIVARGDLMRKINFPKYIVILSSMVSALISLSINLLVVLAFAIFAGVKYHLTVLWLPFNIILLFAVAFGLALILSTLYVKFRDVSHIWEVFMQILVYSMPIMYPISMVSKVSIFGVSVAKLMMLNPIALAIQDIRHNLIALETPTFWTLFQNYWIAMIPISLAIFLVVFGLWYFNKNSKKFVKHVSKSFRLPTEQANGIKQAFVNWTKGIKGYKEQHVLKDISFKVEKGDFFGIVGRNGSGKSTLLKIISQIYTPEKGTVKVNGTLIPFIELGVGFNPELTGRENIYLNGALLGFSKDEVSAMYDEIVEFAELEEFMDQKLKNYSSGMQVRLAFSIAIKAQGDILVLDEVLAVGDEAFQRKCDDFFSKIKKDKTKTVILVTHSMSSVRRYCNKAIMINQGEVASLGSIDEVVEAYTQLNLEKLGKKEPETQEVLGLNDELTKLKINAISKKVVSNKENFEFEVEYNYIGKKKIFLAVAMFDQTRGGIVYDSSQVYVDRGDQKVRFSIPMELFNSSEFKLTASIRDANKKLSGNENLIGFTNDENSLIFKLSNKKEISDYALLNSEVFKVERIK